MYLEEALLYSAGIIEPKFLAQTLAAPHMCVCNYKNDKQLITKIMKLLMQPILTAGLKDAELSQGPPHAKLMVR